MITPRLTIFPGLMCSAGLGFGLFAPPAIAQQPAPPAVEEAPAADGAAPEADPFAVQESDYFLLQEPETAEEFFKGAVQAQQLGRPNLARQYLQRFIELNPEDDALLSLRDEYGPATFARLANQKELQPLSTQLNTRVAEVFRKRGASPERVAALLDALAESPEQAFAAREALINAGDTVIPDILKRLPVEQDDSARQQLLDVLVGMGEEGLPALHAALDAPAESLRIQVISVLGRIGSARSIPSLYFPAYGPNQSAGVRSNARRALEQIAELSQTSVDEIQPDDVALQLRQEAIDAIDAPPPSVDPAATPVDGVRVWSWEPAEQTVRSATLDARSAALWRGIRFARDAFLVAPERSDTQNLYLAFLLEREASQAGTLEPPAGPGTAFNLTLASGPETARGVLGQALEHDLPRAAVGALSVLSKTAAPGSLFSDDKQVVDALNADDPRVQLAAAVAVLRLNPDRSFPHADRVVEILSRALSSEAQPAAVIIDPDFQRGSTLAGFVRGLGYQAVLAASGQEGFLAATERVQPAFLLVNLNVSRWPLSQTLANFRADARTKDLPIVVVGPGERDWRASTVGSTRYTYFRGPGSTDPRAEATEYLAEIPGTAYIVETATAAAFAAQLQPVLTTLVANPLSEAKRAEARALAVFWLAQIADTERKDLFQIGSAEPALVAALSDPALASNAQIALATIPTPTAQSALARMVLAPTADGGLQRSAADLLADHVRRNGILLPRSTVAELNRLWESAQDPALRTSLATWGGSLRPGRTITRQRLEQVPAPVLPAPAPAP
ncbi:MAG: HEAT repeat domain-containing protein [Planctomycetaceae bacterium]